MREPVEPVRPGEEVEASPEWPSDDPIRPGARVRATDGVMGTVKDRKVGVGPEHGYVGVETDEGIIYVPDRLVRETAGNTVLLSVPAADAKAQGSHQTLPVQNRPDELPHEPR
jgi:hypothetical protein